MYNSVIVPLQWIVNTLELQRTEKEFVIEIVTARYRKAFTIPNGHHNPTVEVHASPLPKPPILHSNLNFYITMPAAVVKRTTSGWCAAGGSGGFA